MLIIVKTKINEVKLLVSMVLNHFDYIYPFLLYLIVWLTQIWKFQENYNT